MTRLIALLLLTTLAMSCDRPPSPLPEPEQPAPDPPDPVSPPADSSDSDEADDEAASPKTPANVSDKRFSLSG